MFLFVLLVALKSRALLTLVLLGSAFFLLAERPPLGWSFCLFRECLSESPARWLATHQWVSLETVVNWDSAQQLEKGGLFNDPRNNK